MVQKISIQMFIMEDWSEKKKKIQDISGISEYLNDAAAR